MPQGTASRLHGRAPADRMTRHATVLLGCAGIAPDLDILFNTHRTMTHSVGAVLLTLAVALALLGWKRARLAFALAAAVTSHLLLDWVSFDGNIPTGVMLLWPFDRRFFPPPFPLFMSISKDVLTPSFYTHNTLAIVREAVVLAPALVLIRLVRSRGRAARAGRTVDGRRLLRRHKGFLPPSG